MTEATLPHKCTFELPIPLPDEVIRVDAVKAQEAGAAQTSGYELVPSPNWHYVLKEGMSGTDVAALQINLDITVDGDFGNQTKETVQAFQEKQKLTADGVAGGRTQKRLCIVRSVKAQKDNDLPKGLLASIMANESGFYVAAYSSHPSDWGYDLGAYQSAIGPYGLSPNQDNYYKSYNVHQMANNTGAKVRKQHDAYADSASSRYKNDLANGDSWKFAWDLAVLYHNWPFAAQNIYQYGYIYPDDQARDDEYASWVDIASGGVLTTPRQWVYAYIRKGTVFVSW